MTKRIEFSRALTLAAALIVPFVVSSQLCADTIVRTSGQRLEGVEITKAGWDQVLYKQKGNTAQLPGDKIASIERDSRMVQRIRGPLDSGDYAKAAAAIKRAEGGAQGWELAEVEYLKGRRYLESGEYRKADSAFATYIQKNQASKDYWIPHAVLGRGQGGHSERARRRRAAAFQGSAHVRCHLGRSRRPRRGPGQGPQEAVRRRSQPLQQGGA